MFCVGDKVRCACGCGLNGVIRHGDSSIGRYEVDLGNGQSVFISVNGGWELVQGAPFTPINRFVSIPVANELPPDRALDGHKLQTYEQAAGQDCTCRDLLNGHLPECKYPRRGEAA